MSSKYYFYSILSVAHVLYLIFDKESKNNDLTWLQLNDGPLEEHHDTPNHGLYHGFLPCCIPSLGLRHWPPGETMIGQSYLILFLLNFSLKIRYKTCATLIIEENHFVTGSLM